MQIPQFVNILRRFWPMLVLVPLVAAALSAGLALRRPPVYEASARMLASRGITPENSTVGKTVANEDSVAQDMPAIISGSLFARDAAARMRDYGYVIDAGTVQASLSASADGDVVTINARSTDQQQAVAIVRTATRLLDRNGLRYWGERNLADEQSGVVLGLIDTPIDARLVDTTRQIMQDALLRGVVALMAAVALVIVLGQRATRPSPTSSGKLVKDKR